MNATIGLGSNLGDREAMIRLALDDIARMPGTRLVNASSLYDTEPTGEEEQPRFLNAVAVVVRARAAYSHCASVGSRNSQSDGSAPD